MGVDRFWTYRSTDRFWTDFLVIGIIMVRNN